MPFHTNQKKIISDALLQLLEEKTITKITIPEICSKADISKATFYNYFSDKYDILVYIAGMMFKEAPKPEQIDSADDYFLNHLLKTLTIVYKHRSSMRHILSYGKQNSIYQTLFQMSIDYLQSELHLELTYELKNYCIGYTFARLGLLKTWLETDVFFADIEHAVILKNLCPAPLNALFGLNGTSLRSANQTPKADQSLNQQ